MIVLNGGISLIPYAPCMVYLPTKLGDFVRANVGKYSSTMEHLGMFNNKYPLVMTNIAMVFRCPIEIDGLPIKNGGSFHGKLLVITRFGKPQFSYGFPMIFPCSYGFPMVFRFSYVFPMFFLWFSYGFPMVFLWFSHGFPMVFLWFSYGFPMVFLWFSHGFPMVFLWFSYGLCGFYMARCGFSISQSPLRSEVALVVLLLGHGASWRFFPWENLPFF